MLARREFLKQAGFAAAAQSAVQAAGENAIIVDPKPLFGIYLFVQDASKKAALAKSA